MTLDRNGTFGTAPPRGEEAAPGHRDGAGIRGVLRRIELLCRRSRILLKGRGGAGADKFCLADYFG